MENPVVVGRVTVQLLDGREEVWAIPLRPSSAGPYYHWWIYLPEGARVIEKSAEVLPLSAGQEIKVDVAEVPISYRRGGLDPSHPLRSPVMRLDD
ncbi:MAG TPA: hypothetical protein VEZ12_03365 [Herpetosiphonaceae bacterium]|nr:hypothetical protein [Herpetosiphonaceae bacterium]